MATIRPRTLQAGQVVKALSNSTYRLRGPATTHHKNVWLANRESDGCQVIVKSPLRYSEKDQMRAIRELKIEAAILAGPLKNAEGIRQLVDEIVLAGESADDLSAQIFEHLQFDLYELHRTGQPRFSNRQIKSIAQQILNALSIAHKLNIVHTDLKPENIILSSSSDPNPLVKLIDFGVASRSNEDRGRKITNPFWRSPESWLGMPWGPPADIWSFGAILGSLLTEPGVNIFRPLGGLKDVPAEDEEREFVRTLWTIAPFSTTFLNQAPKFWQADISKFVPKLAPTGDPVTLAFIADIFAIEKTDWAFVQEVLEPDPSRRPSADELLQHAWFKS